MTQPGLVSPLKTRFEKPILYNKPANILRTKQTSEHTKGVTSNERSHAAADSLADYKPSGKCRAPTDTDDPRIWTVAFL